MMMYCQGESICCILRCIARESRFAAKLRMQQSFTAFCQHFNGDDVASPRACWRTPFKMTLQRKQTPLGCGWQAAKARDTPSLEAPACRYTSRAITLIRPEMVWCVFVSVCMPQCHCAHRSTRCKVAVHLNGSYESNENNAAKRELSDQ